MRLSLKHLVIALLLGSLLLAVPLTFAQEAAPAAETTDIPTGLSVGIFLIGCVAIIIVGGASLARDSYKSDSEKK